MQLKDSPKLEWQRSMRQMCKYAARFHPSMHEDYALLIAEAYQDDPIEVLKIIDGFYTGDIS